MLQAKSWSKLILMGGVLMALGVIGGGARVARADGPLAQPAHMNAGDLLVDLGTLCGSEACEGNPSDGWDILTSAGAYKGTLRLGGKDNEGLGLAFENSGRILLNDEYDVSRFGHSGGNGELVASPFGETSGYARAFALDVPENIYAAVVVGGEVSIWRFPRNGTGYDSAAEVAVDPLAEPDDYHMSVVGLFGCTLAYGGKDQVKRYDICTHSQLADYPVAPTVRPRELHVLLDGSLISAEGGTVKRIKVDGTVEEYGDTETGCLWSADASNNLLYILDVCASRIDAFDLSTGNPIGLVKQYTEAEIAARGSYPVALRVYNHVAPPKPVIFVHGLNQDASRTDNEFPSVLRDSALSPNARYFHYYQDRADAGACGANLPAVPPDAGIPIDAGSEGTSQCDSQSDIGLNALALDEFVAQQYAQSGGQKVVLVGYSMGASIIRGFLDYSTGANAGAGDGVAGAMVDSVMFIAGAHDGSWALLPFNAGSALGSAIGLESFVDDWIGQVTADFHVDFARPPGTELSPFSSWYAWANSPDRPLPADIGYYNAYGNIDVKGEGCVWRPFFGSICHDFHLLDLGDGALLPGDSDPYVSDWRGGARFERPNTTEQWEWNYYDELIIHPRRFATHPVREGQKLVTTLLARPGLHFNIRTQSHNAFVFDCVSQTNVVRLDDQLLHIIQSKVGLEAYQCPTH
jgi:hypothetical protein